MRNKRWKRKAKRLYGYCHNTKCYSCKYFKLALCTPYELDYMCCADSSLPILTGIRMLEKEFKNNVSSTKDIKNRVNIWGK